LGLVVENPLATLLLGLLYTLLLLIRLSLLGTSFLLLLDILFLLLDHFIYLFGEVEDPLRLPVAFLGILQGGLALHMDQLGA